MQPFCHGTRSCALHTTDRPPPGLCPICAQRPALGASLKGAPYCFVLHAKTGTELIRLSCLLRGFRCGRILSEPVAIQMRGFAKSQNGCLGRQRPDELQQQYRRHQ